MTAVARLYVFTAFAVPLGKQTMMRGAVDVRGRLLSRLRVEEEMRMTRHTVRTLVVTFVVLGACPLPSGEAQTLGKDAAYWQSYVAAMKRNDTFKVRLNDGRTLRGRLIDRTPEEMIILRNRAFRRGVEQRVRFDAVENLSRTHPTRDQFIYLPLVALGLFLAAIRMGTP